MTRYERRVLAVGEDGSLAVEGRIVAVLDSPRTGQTQITALVEIAEEDAPTGETSPEAVEDETFYCGEPKSNDEPCEREVDQPDDTCWQH